MFSASSAELGVGIRSSSSFVRKSLGAVLNLSLDFSARPFNRSSMCEVIRPIAGMLLAPLGIITSAVFFVYTEWKHYVNILSSKWWGSD